MAQNQQLDSLHFDSLDFPYNTEQNPLVEKPRIATGINTWVKWGGSIAKRPGTVGITGSGFNLRIDRLWLYQTIEASPKIYILASAFAGTYWEMYYLRLDATSPAWTKFTDIRNVNYSTAPHECVIARGYAYIKSLPHPTASEKLGSMRFDGTGGTVTYDYWGILGPDTPVSLTLGNFLLNGDLTSGATTMNVTDPISCPAAAPFDVCVDTEIMSVTNLGTGLNWTVSRGMYGTSADAHKDNTRGLAIPTGWSASDHSVQVYYGWKYSYAYKTRTGQYSNRAAQETNPDRINISNTQAFYNYRPEMVLYNNTGASSTTYVPWVGIFRTTDGGGTLFDLDTISNAGGVGATNTYNDEFLGSGSSGTTYHDPIPDTDLSANDTAPSLTSNSPPPTCNAPSITGVSDPQPYSPIAYYAGRIWFAINEVLYYSAQEELTMGIPEESFPSGLRGNFFRYSHPIKNVVSGTNGLYIFTTNSIHQITGTNKESFSSRVVLENVGVPIAQPRAVARLGSSIAVLTDDEKIVLLVENDKYEYDKVIVLTDPLGTAISTQIAAYKEVDLDYYRNGSYEWLVVSCHRKDSTINSVQYICDLTRSRESDWKDIFWYTPWYIYSTACVSGRIRETETRHRLVWYIWDPTTSNGCLAYLDDTGTTYTDAAALLGSGATNYTHYWGTNLFSVPPGNHINALRKAAYNPVLAEIRYDRKNFTGDANPSVTYYTDDDYSTAGTAGTNTIPSRRNQSSGYTSLVVPVRTQCQRAAVKFTGSANSYGAEYYNLSFVWEASGGN